MGLRWRQNLRKVEVPASFIDILHFLSDGFVSRYFGITLRMTRSDKISILIPPWSGTPERQGRNSEQFRVIVFGSQINVSAPTRKAVLFVRIKAVRGHSPLAILYPVFLNLNLLFARRSSFGSFVSQGSLINLCRVLQRPGKRGGSFLLVVGVTSGERLTLIVPTRSKFPKGRTPRSRNQINKIFALLGSTLNKNARETKCVVKISEIIDSDTSLRK